MILSDEAAKIVHTLIANVTALNKELVKEGLSKILLTVNHDNFGINVQYAHLLIPLVREAYNSLNKLSYNGLEFPVGRGIKCINPNFRRTYCNLITLYAST